MEGSRLWFSFVIIYNNFNELILREIIKMNISNLSTKIISELKKAKIDDEQIDNVFNISSKQLKTLESKTIPKDTASSVQDVFSDFLTFNTDD